MPSLFERASALFQELQADICRRLETLDGAARFGSDRWERAAGGGGVARVLEGGAVFEKAGVNWSRVMDPRRYVGLAPQQTRTYVKRTARPIIRKALNPAVKRTALRV